MGNADGFSGGRKAIDIHKLDIASGPRVTTLIDYPNVPRLVGILISNGKATLHELDTVYGWEDAYDLLEIIIVDAHNRKLLTPSPVK